MNVRFRERNSSWTLTRVDWSRGGPHPRRFVRTDIHPGFLKWLRSGSRCKYDGVGDTTTTVCFLFARKFLADTLYRLLKFAPKVMQFDG